MAAPPAPLARSAESDWGPAQILQRGQPRHVRCPCVRDRNAVPFLHASPADQQSVGPAAARGPLACSRRDRCTSDSRVDNLGGDEGWGAGGGSGREG
eukprot:3994955-Pyramimonas_sp.AAC.1